MEEIREFILEYIQSEYSLPEDIDYDEFDFVESGYIDSIAMISFVAELEDRFDISFDDYDLESAEFRTVGSLAEMIEEKMRNN